MKSLWPQITDITGEYQKLITKRTTAEHRLQTVEERSAKLVNTRTELQRQHDTCASASAGLEYVLRQLDEGLPVTDSAKWIRLIDPLEKTEIFDLLNYHPGLGPRPAIRWPNYSGYSGVRRYRDLTEAEKRIYKPISRRRDLPARGLREFIACDR
jgi:hypothetical protein